MKLNIKTMKANRFILPAIIVLLINSKVISQSSKVDSIFWNNGNVSLLSELDRVWIIQKKGNTIKDARIVEIKKDKGVLVYEKEKCLHDISINYISKIQPGKYPQSIMVFQADNTPNINRLYEYLDHYSEPSDFKCVIKKESDKNAVQPKPLTKAPVSPPLVISNENVHLNDTLINEEGIVIPIKIISIENKILNYKKANNPDGPIYVKPFGNAIITKYANSSTINLHINQ